MLCQLTPDALPLTILADIWQERQGHNLYRRSDGCSLSDCRQGCASHGDHNRKEEFEITNKIEKLKTAAHAATDALWRAEAIERDKHNATLVGKCFKYSNAGGGCDERWWLYLKVTAVDDGNLRAFRFEQRPNETIEIEPSSFVYHGRSLGPDGWYTEIDPSEFDRELAELRAKINGYLPPTQPELTE